MCFDLWWSIHVGEGVYLGASLNGWMMRVDGGGATVAATSAEVPACMAEI